MSIDLRSDTVTHPSPSMREAIASATVGDDTLDGDPTTRRLESRVAEVLGTEAALFFPSGTQANLTGLLLHAEPGSEVLLEAGAHHIHYEHAGLAAIGGVQIRPIPADGRLTADHVRDALRPNSRFFPRPSVLSVENTHNQSGGRVTPPSTWDALVAVAGDLMLPVHLDGARLWNAAVAADVPVERLARGATTIMVSFSKGLGCPVGSCLAGSRDDMDRAWTIRRRLGGGMRQSGMLAAAALYALEHHLPGLAEDHAKARRFAERLTSHAALVPIPPETNIVMLDLRGDRQADWEAARLAERGLRLSVFGTGRLRAVFHRDVSPDEADRAADLILDVVR